MSGKTVLVAITRGWDVRGILRTGVLEPMRAAGIRCVLLSPRAEDPEFRKEFGHLDLEFYPQFMPGRLEGTYRRALNAMYSVRFPGHTLDIFAERMAGVENREHPLKRAFYRTLRGAAKLNPGLYEVAKRAEWLFPGDARVRAIFERWKPDAVVTAPLFDWSDIPVLKWAQKAGVPSAAIVASWDNISSKGAIPIRPDALVVWNEDMAMEARERHAYLPECVAVTGVPPFDHYSDPPRPREAFMKKYGLDPSRKLIGFMGASPRILPNEHEVFAHVVEANERGAFGEKLPIFLRLHPRERRKEWEQFRGRPGIVVEKPDHTSGNDWDANHEDLAHLADTVRACDVSMNVCSTVTLECCLEDKPVINIYYDGDRKPPYIESAARYVHYSHYKTILDAGIPAVFSREELIAKTKACLDDPALDREARKKVVHHLCGPVGGAAARTGRALASFVLNGPKSIAAAAALPPQATTPR